MIVYLTYKISSSSVLGKVSKQAECWRSIPGSSWTHQLIIRLNHTVIFSIIIFFERECFQKMKGV